MSTSQSIIAVKGACQAKMWVTIHLVIEVNVVVWADIVTLSSPSSLLTS